MGLTNKGLAVGLLGFVAILLLAYGLSRHRRAIHWRLVVCGLCLQILIAITVLRMPGGPWAFQQLGHGIETLLHYADVGGGFVFGPLVSNPEKMIELFGPAGGFIFAFKLVPTIVFVAALASWAYYIGLLPWVVQRLAWAVDRLMGASGAEALSNSASVFVGQIEAQLLIKPYVETLTKSELLSVMSGSMACIAGGVMAVYIQMGIPASAMITASLMAIPGALVISKLVWPETEISPTQGNVVVHLEQESLNSIDALARGAADGLKIGLNVCAMLMAFLALMALVDGVLGWTGATVAHWVDPQSEYPTWFGLDWSHLTLASVLGQVFSPMAWLLGVPSSEAPIVGGLMGTKLVTNEFVAYSQLSPLIRDAAMSAKSITIASFALCGFANVGSVAMQLGGIGEMAPNRKGDLARLGLWALLCGSLASYASAALAGVLMPGPGSWPDGAIALLAALALGVLVGVNFIHYRSRWQPKTFKTRLEALK